MEPLRSTDYFAIIPKVRLPVPEILYPIRAEIFRWHVMADLSLLALVLATATIVATVFLNWPR